MLIQIFTTTERAEAFQALTAAALLTNADSMTDGHICQHVLQAIRDLIAIECDSPKQGEAFYNLFLAQFGEIRTAQEFRDAIRFACEFEPELYLA